MASLNLKTPLIQVRSIGPKFLAKLKRLKIETVKDLLWHFPSRYEDFSQIYKIAELQPHQEATIRAVVKKIVSRRTWHRKLFLVEALLSDDSGSIQAIWFNQPYIKNILRPGRWVNFSGRVYLKEEQLYLSNPTYELVSENFFQETKHTGRIIPIYPETRGLTSKGLRYLIKPVLDNLQKITEYLPKEVLEKQGLPEINFAIKKIHFPDNLNQALEAKRRFAFEDLFFLQLFNLREKLKLTRQRSPAIVVSFEEIKKNISRLPFSLTNTQKRALWDIVQDLQKPQPMNRLLQGDVGSGKTIVAALAALEVSRENYQTVFMAPTEILARQHYQTFLKFFPNFEKGVALLTSSEARIFYGQGLETNLKKTELIKKIGDDKINNLKNNLAKETAMTASGLPISKGVKIIIGTHALIQKNVNFPNLALIIVDEQHRFGVKQRAALLNDTNNANTSECRELPDRKEKIAADSHSSPRLIPHFLSMSATPIPRTLSLALFGDLDISLITELPKNRKPIITKVVPPIHRQKAYQFIREQIQQGRQAFVICPRIAASEDKNKTHPFYNGLTTFQDGKNKLLSEVKNVTEEYEKLSKKVFPDLRVTMLHGKLKPREKEKIMHDFVNHKTDILVSTSVIEVGVDIPNATIMMIEGAERFGLAQLYQFRGRVGRGEHQSYCFLFTESEAKTTQARLKAVAEAKNGFELAEIDLKLRGPGEFLGEVQTGMPDLAMKALQNPELTKNCRQIAWQILQKDYDLKNYPLLRRRLSQFQKEVHWE